VSSLWRLNQDFQLCWKEWDSQLVLYHTGSGDTHLFDQSGYQLLKLLQTKPRTLSELERQLWSDDEDQAITGEHDATELNLDDFLDDLQRLGIVEQVDS